MNEGRAYELLRSGTGIADATFRPDQLEAIRHLVEGESRLLMVQATGWGKSFVYFIAAKLLRESGMGPALLISPLLSLMRNQLAAAARMGVRAETIHSGNTDDWDEIEGRIQSGDTDILLISPERLANERFRANVLGPISGTVSMLVVDEAHCVSDWGHDFRPQYRMIQHLVAGLPANLRLLATTATANDRVMADLQEVLGPNLTVQKGTLARPSLFLQTIRLESGAERMAWLAEQIPNLPGTGIVYTLTVRDAERVAEWLVSQGINAEAYTGASLNREELEDALLGNKVKALVATTALGMGYDKPDLAFVIHFQMPGSVVHYYQQVGRAGRALDKAYGILLSGREEKNINDYFIESAFPSRALVDQVLDALAKSDCTVSQLQFQINATQGKLKKALTLLSLERPASVSKERYRWMRTTADVPPAFWERIERLTALRRAEQEQMREYVGLEKGHMEFLIEALDGDASNFSPPDLPTLPVEVNGTLLKAAQQFSSRTGYDMKPPRKRWANGGLPEMGVKGNIDEDLRSERGLYLCRYGTEPWGELVRNGKYKAGKFSDGLVEESRKLILKHWKNKGITWVTCIPSARHPDLVPNFARCLAEALDLPFVQCLQTTRERPQQKEMENSILQARNADGAFSVNQSPQSGPVLLVDDIVDSLWTLTVGAYFLRTEGSGPVYPFALASTSLS